MYCHLYILIIQTYKYIFYTHCSPSSQLLEESQQLQVWKATARLWKQSREFCSLLPFKDPKIQTLTYLMRKKFWWNRFLKRHPSFKNVVQQSVSEGMFSTVCWASVFQRETFSTFFASPGGVVFYFAQGRNISMQMLANEAQLFLKNKTKGSQHTKNCFEN